MAIMIQHILHYISSLNLYNNYWTLFAQKHYNYFMLIMIDYYQRKEIIIIKGFQIITINELG